MSDSTKILPYTTVYLNKKHYNLLRNATEAHYFEYADPRKFEEGTVTGAPWFKADDLLVIQQEDSTQ